MSGFKKFLDNWNIPIILILLGIYFIAPSVFPYPLVIITSWIILSYINWNRWWYNDSEFSLIICALSVFLLTLFLYMGA